MQSVQPPEIARIINGMAAIGRSPQSQLHVFTLLRKLFKDSQETFQLLTFNPVLLAFKPKIPTKEAAFLNPDQVRQLLSYVKDKPFGKAIWLHFFLGLRAGELQALRWSDVDQYSGVVLIQRTYVRLEKRFKDYPKGKKHHWRPIPPELYWVLDELRSLQNGSDLVVRSPGYHMLSYEHYNRTLNQYCRELGLPIISTHGLRHSTSALYLSAGANKDDIQKFFAHSSQQVTERYLHHHGSRLGELAKVIELFPEVSQKLHKCGNGS